MTKSTTQRKRQAKLELVRPTVVEVKVEMPIELYEKTIQRLKRVGSSFEDFVRISMRSYLRQQVIYNLHDTMQFGKYQGESIEGLIRFDPKYVEWCLNNTQIFKLDAEAHSLLETMQSINDQD